MTDEMGSEKLPAALLAELAGRCARLASSPTLEVRPGHQDRSKLMAAAALADVVADQLAWRTVIGDLTRLDGLRDAAGLLLQQVDPAPGEVVARTTARYLLMVTWVLAGPAPSGSDVAAEVAWIRRVTDGDDTRLAITPPKVVAS